MKTLIIILTLIFSSHIYGQEQINLLTKKGQKTGKWIEYNDNGTINEVNFYEPNFSTKNHEVFVYDTWKGGTDTVHSADTTHYGESLLWTEYYEYGFDEHLKRIVKYARGEGPVFLYGPNKEIGIIKDEFSINNRVAEREEIILEIQNESDYPIELSPIFRADNLSANQDQLVISPKSESTFIFKILIEQGEQNYIVTLKNDSISIGIFVKTTGYHLQSDDLFMENQFSASDELIYWRSGNEALLRLYDKKQEKILKTFSVAKERVVVDLKGLNPGNYLLCKRDFGNGDETCCKLIVEE